MIRVARQGGSIFWKIMVVVFGAALLATILIPLEQREEREMLRRTTYLHLVDLYLAEQFFFEGRQYYTSDPESLLSYINNVRSMRIDTVDIGTYYAPGDTIKETNLWKIVGPRDRVRSVYVSPIDSSRYLLIVKDGGTSITIKDPNGIGEIRDGQASWMEGRRTR